MHGMNSDLKNLVRLFVVSILALYLELSLIRWIATEAPIFSYLNNIVLVVCFVGLGLGCLSAKRNPSTWVMVLPQLAFFGVMCIPVIRQTFEGIGFFLEPIANPYGMILSKELPTTFSIWLQVGKGLVLATLLLALVLKMFIPLGKSLGFYLSAAPGKILPYSVNILGSLIGVLLFSFFSYLQFPPLYWFIPTPLLLLALYSAEFKKSVIYCVILIPLIVVASLYDTGVGDKKVIWSPYQKLTVIKNQDPFLLYEVKVNNLPFSSIHDFRPENLEKHKELLEFSMDYSQYEIPYRVAGIPHEVLIIGAGPGDDIAAGLRNNVGRIKAVEIDPAMRQIASLHPENPYSSDQVQIVIDDARAVLNQESEQYELLIIGALDAHASSGSANMRLDHYVYTQESFSRMKKLIGEKGVLFMNFHAVHPFLVDRLATALKRVFQEEPLVFVLPESRLSAGTVMFVAGNLDKVRGRIASDPTLKKFIDYGTNVQVGTFNGSVQDAITHQASVTTDDWPFLYLPAPTIPSIHVLIFFAVGRSRPDICPHLLTTK